MLKQTVEEITQQYGLAYFGRMGASISHDIKNCLAIINENAGLMSDLLMMAQKGGPVDIDRFSAIVERIEKQVVRADGIVKSMNMFSHSMDQPEQQIDLDQAIILATGLGTRIFANAGIEVRHEACPDKRYVKGSFFFLLFLIWTILENVTQTLASGTILNISSRQETDKQTGLSFQSDHAFSQTIVQRMVQPDMVQLLEMFDAKFTLDDQTNLAVLVFGQ